MTLVARLKRNWSAAGKAFDVIDVRADGVSKAQLIDWVGKVDWQKLLNTRSTTWRGLSDDEKTDVDQSQAICLMADHPTLIKRPVIEDGDQLYVGWTQANKDALL